MFNSILFVVSVFLYLIAVILMYKFFGKTGLYVFTAFAAILANIQVTKCIDVFGVSTTSGNVIYAASFLVTDILSEKYGKKSARKAVYIGIAVTIMFMLGTQDLLHLKPNSSDFVDPALQEVFGLVPRITIASILGYACSQTIDVTLYHAIWKKTGSSSKKLWMRNCGSTLISQAVDTVVFTTVAFLGMYETPVFVSILLTTYLFKAIVAFCDTPFIYLSTKIKVKGETQQTKLN